MKKVIDITELSRVYGTTNKPAIDLTFSTLSSWRSCPGLATWSCLQAVATLLSRMNSQMFSIPNFYTFFSLCSIKCSNFTFQILFSAQISHFMVVNPYYLQHETRRCFSLPVYLVESRSQQQVSQALLSTSNPTELPVVINHVTASGLTNTKCQTSNVNVNRSADQHYSWSAEQPLRAISENRPNQSWPE